MGTCPVPNAHVAHAIDIELTEISAPVYQNFPSVGSGAPEAFVWCVTGVYGTVTDATIIRLLVLSPTLDPALPLMAILRTRYEQTKQVCIKYYYVCKS